MDSKVCDVLFLCTGNSACSSLAEVLLNHFGKGRFRTYSAGGFPKGAVHLLTLDLLDRVRLSTAGLRSKSWDEFTRQGASVMGITFTVRNQVAGEDCPNRSPHLSRRNCEFCC